MSCKFSAPFTGSSSVVSTNNEFVACITPGNRVSVRSLASLEDTHIFQCVDKIDKIEISPDNGYILCALFSRNVVQVFSLEDREWKCRINEGVAGIINAYWTPDSRNVVTESDFGIQLSLWSLTDSNSVIVSLPKPPFTQFSKTTAFTDCGRFLAVVHRIELQDQIGVYSVASQTSLGMSEVSKFRARSNDVASVYWVPSGTHIITLDSPLTYKVCAYSPMGECLMQYVAYQNALGIRCIGLARARLLPPAPAAVPPSASALSEGKFLALGSFDSKVRLISAYSWQVAFVLPLVHPTDLEAGFNGHDLKLTVEYSTRPATVFGGLDGGDGAEESGFGRDGGAEEDEDADPAQDADSSGRVVAPKQRQVSPALQLLNCGAFRPAGQRAIAVDGGAGDDRNDAADDADAGDRAASRAFHAHHGSYFALRSMKTLPRTQAFVLETKRVLASTTAGKTAKKPAPAAASTSSGTGAGGHSASSSSGFPAVGVSWVGWSKSSNLLAAREEAHPRCVWVWRPLHAQLLALIVTLEPVLCARWRSAPQNASDPAPPASEEADVLAFCTGTDRVYFWTAAGGVTFADMSALTSDHLGGSGARHGFAVISLRWAEDGSTLLLRGKESHCACQVSLPISLKGPASAK